MSLIGKEITEFEAQAFHEGEFKTIKKEDLLGKWNVLFFYPADFTFVCPTELEDLANKYEEFKKINCEIYSVSCDTHFVHKAWHDTSKTIKKINYPMLADPTAKLAKDLKTINDKLPSQIIGVFDKMLATDKKSSPKSIEEIRSYVDFMAKQVSLDATHVAYKPVQTRYGTAVTGDLRGSLKYDGFRNTYSLIGYAVPTDKGVSLQILMSDDSSYDYWANELNHMYQTQSLKGGK